MSVFVKNKIPSTDITPQFRQFLTLMQWSNKLYRSNPDNTTVIMDISSDDVQNLIRSLNRHKVQFMLVGGMAGLVYGHTRTTQDIDLWIKKTTDNQNRLIAALAENDVAGAIYLKDNPLIFGWTSVRFGGGGFELDLGHSLKNFTNDEFDECFERSKKIQFDGVEMNVLHLNDLIAEKKAVGRLKDLADVEELQKRNKL